MNVFSKDFRSSSQDVFFSKKRYILQRDKEIYQTTNSKQEYLNYYLCNVNREVIAFARTVIYKNNNKQLEIDVDRNCDEEIKMFIVDGFVNDDRECKKHVAFLLHNCLEDLSKYKCAMLIVNNKVDNFFAYSSVYGNFYKQSLDFRKSTFGHDDFDDNFLRKPIYISGKKVNKFLEKYKVLNNENVL